MSEKKTKTISEVIVDIEKNKSTFYFLVIDSEDRPNATVSHIYKQAKILHDSGHNVVMLVETKVKNPNKWLGTYFHTLKIKSAADVNSEVKIKPSDFLVIPEIFVSVLKSTANVPYKRIIICQNYELALEVLEPGQHWLKDFGVGDAIVTNKNMADWVENVFLGVKARILPIGLNTEFENKKMLRKPKILIYGRSAKDIMNFGKEFILRNPLYSWVTFKHVIEMSTEELVKEMNESLCLIWLDKNASFGTLPLEAMATNLPVVGLVPEMVPEWLTPENGTWCLTKDEMLTATNLLVKGFLEDSFDYNELIDYGSYKPYSESELVNNTLNVYNDIVNERIKELETKRDIHE